jgi:perosamine synthetase
VKDLNLKPKSNYFELIGDYFKIEKLLTDSYSDFLIVTDVNDNAIGYLVPFSHNDLNDISKINLLTEWRNTNVNVFPTRFSASYESTYNWLKNLVLLNPNRILFWVINCNNEIIGHLGVLKKQGDIIEYELDNVIRGNNASPGLMSRSIIRLEEWIESEFSSEFFFLKVLESNSHAINFYKKIGYEIKERIPLKVESSTDLVKLIPGEPEVDAFLIMSKNIVMSRIKVDKILTAGPTISTLEISFVNDAVRNGWNSKHSDFINLFESSFAEYVGSKYAMTTSSCTGALHIALLALGVTEGDEVIVPEVTWVATASAVRYVGATPVFAEIDPKTWTISLDSIKKLVSNKTKVIIPVHLYGYAANIIEINNFAKSLNIYVIEDAAPAIGTKIENKFVGTIGDIGCFSFQGAKMLVTGEGGMFVTNDESLYKKAKKIQDHGRKPGTFWIEELGYKYKMSNIQAALGYAQLLRVENQIFRKRRINNWYREGLKIVPGITFQEELHKTKSICWMTSIKLENSVKIDRDELIHKLSKFGIDSRPVFPAISQYSFWNSNTDPQPHALEIGNRSINLPSGVNISKSTLDFVISKLIEIIK